MKNKKCENVCHRWMNNIRRTITSAFAWLLCGAMLMGSMPMALPVRAQEAPCTQAAHVHVEDCYVQVTVETLERMICIVDADVIVHQHTDFCYDEAGELRCALEEKEVHTHGEECLNAEQSLICQKEVLELHTHGADCYDAEGALVCEEIQVVEHVHTEECFAAETVPVDTEGLTCSITDETHAHGKLCYGTWVLDCDRPEHTHTEACGIATTPSRTSETPTETTEGAEKTDTITPSAENQKSLPETSTGKQFDEYLDQEDGDKAYISNLHVSKCEDGAYPLDTNDEPGNDSSLENGILRTYDTAVYTIQFDTHLCDSLDDNFGGYVKGRVHYEFILPFGPTEAQFETGAMEWMSNSEGGRYTLEVDAEKNIQILRGSYVLVPTDDNPVAISEGTQTLKVVIRALTLKNGTTVMPYFTLWLDNNHDFSGNEIIYDTHEDPIHTGVITELTSTKKADCSGSENDKHTPQTCEGTALTITAAPRYNVFLVETPPNVNSTKGTFDFSGNPKAPNSDMGIIDGRLYCFGIGIELWGGTGISQDGRVIAKGLQGIELPAGDLSLTIQLISEASRDETGGPREDVTATHTPLVWSGGEDEGAVLTNIGRETVVVNGVERIRDYDHETERETGSAVGIRGNTSYYLPGNWRLNTEEARNTYHRATCYNGGNWTVGVDEQGDRSIVQVTVSGFEINLNHFPSGYASETTKNRYFNPQSFTIDETKGVINFWDLPRGVFSAGELWVIQPYDYTGSEAELPEGKTAEDMDLRELYGSGTLLLTAKIIDADIPGTYTTSHNNSNMAGNVDYTNKDSITLDRPFSQKGTTGNTVYYLQYGESWPDYPLAPGGQDTQSDWAFQGQRATLVASFSQTNAEDRDRSAAVDLFIKFDNTFFEPTGYHHQYSTAWGDDILWAGKVGGWEHYGCDPDETDQYNEQGELIKKGYDYDQRTARPVDVVFFKSLEDLKNAGYTCVGAMIQRRQIADTGSARYSILLDGTVKEDAKLGYTYLLNYTCSSWTLENVRNYLHDENILDNDAVLSDDEYNAQYARGSYLPYLQEKTANGITGYVYVNPTDGIKADYRQFAVDEDGNILKNRHLLGQKATYTNGVYEGGTGAPGFIDACLVIPYKTIIEKHVAQTNSDGSEKSAYDMGLGQRYIDYKLIPSADREMGGQGSAAGAERKIVLQISDILPKGVSPCVDEDGNLMIYWEGQNGHIDYQQGAGWRTPGTVTGGIRPTTSGNDTDQWFEVKCDLLANGKWRIIFTFHNVIFEGDRTDFGAVYLFTEMTDDFPDGAQLENVTYIRSFDDRRELTVENGNMDSVTVKVIRNASLNITKVPVDPYLEWYDPIGFTITSGNNSGESVDNAIIMDSLPINGLNGTHFNGSLMLTDFSAKLRKEGQLLDLNDMTFYYTTSANYRGYADENGGLRVNTLSQAELTKEGSVWEEISMVKQADGTWHFNFESVDQTKQITAIVACGDIPAGYTLELNVTMKLPEGRANDYLVNYLSQTDELSHNSSLYTNSYVRVVSRTISGKTWLDREGQNLAGVDHLYGDGDELLDGVKVELLRKNSSGEYVPFYYQDTVDSGNPVPVVIQTGQRVSVQNSASVEDHETGQYLFMDLPAGDYAVRFSSGDDSVEGAADISKFTASEMNCGENDAIDSDAEPVYDADGLRYTLITGIVLPEAESNAMQSAFGKYESRNNDSGFNLIQYELPLTGGFGTTIYYILGAALALPALIGLRHRKKK